MVTRSRVQNFVNSIEYDTECDTRKNGGRIFIIKSKFYKTIIVLSLLMVGMLFQPVSTTGSSSETVGNQITSEISGVNSIIPETSNNGLVPTTPTSQEANINNLESPFFDSYLKRDRNPRIQVESNERELPEGISTWGSVVEKMKKNPSPYASIKDEALVKLHNSNLVETVVKVDSMILTDEIMDFFAKYNAEILDSYPILATHVVLVEDYLLQAFINEAAGVVGISYVQPNYYYSASFVPDDVLYTDQYGPQIIGMETAWDIQLGNVSVVVAIIDTGIDYTHPDLGNYLPIGYDWYNDDDDPFDDNGHGTHVSGTIGATINNALGIAGVANVSFFAEKFLDQFGFGSDIGGANAIMHAVDVGADILSNSWGGSGVSQLLEDAVNYAISNGVIVVAAAGNGNTDQFSYPAAYPDVIAVAGTDEFDNRYTSSNFGPWVDISAPAVNVLSTVPWGYDSFTGTSMATPHVSGLLALLKSQYPTYDRLQLENLLYTTAVDLGDPGFDDFFGWGRIDASSAIVGLQDHNLRASIMAPPIIPADLPTQVSGRVTNLGLRDEFNVNISLAVDGGIINETTIPFLPTGTSFDLVSYYQPKSVGLFEITFNADPVAGEVVISDNNASRIVEATNPVINPKLGTLMNYGQMGGDTPYQIRWEFIDTSDPLSYIMDLWLFDAQVSEEFVIDTFTLNVYTREFSSIFFPQGGVLWPYMFQIDIQIGDRFDFFNVGAQDGFVVDEGFVEYYGELIPVWIVDEGFEFALISKTDGMLIALRDYNFNPIIYDLVYNNLLFETSNLHNLRTLFVGQIYVEVGVPGTIDVFVQNTGSFYEESQLSLTVDNQTVGMLDVFLNPGDYQYLSFNWMAPDFGQYFAFLEVFPVFDEFYFDDNFEETIISVAELTNYNLSFPTFQWLDAAANGLNLNFFGDDSSIPVDLPFQFEFYDQVFNTVYVSSNGWMSFVDSNPFQYWYPGFPTSEMPYAVALFLSDLIAEGNVYLWSTPEFVVIEYLDYNYLWQDLAGTFEVVFFATGEILFQYQFVNYEASPVGKGINHGLNLNFFSILGEDLTGRTDFAALFSKEIPLGDTDLAAGLNIPNNLEAGQLGYIEAYVQNLGSVDAEFVELTLLIDGVQISSTIAELIPAGETLKLGQYWVPPYNGEFLVEAIVTPIAGEVNVDNNYASQFAVVGGVHDLQVFLEIIHLGGNEYVINGIVVNIGDTEEYNVQLQIFINGVPVTQGEIETLRAGMSFSVQHYWITDGPAEIAVFAPYVPNEDILENNLAVQFFEPVVEELGSIVIQVVDLTTGQGLGNVEVFINSFNYSEFGFTNSSGGYETLVPLGEYWIDVFLDGYNPQFFTVFLFNPGEIAFLFIELETIGEFYPYDVVVVDLGTGAPIEGANVWISSPSFFAFGMTDFNGTFSTDMPLGEYWVDIEKDGYFRTSINILFDLPENNLLVVYLEPFGEMGILDVIVYDLETGIPIEFADIYIDGPTFVYGQTNASGVFETIIPLGEYWVDIYKDGYFSQSFIILIDIPNEVFTLLVSMEPLGELVQLDVNVYDIVTGEPIAFADVWVSSPSFGVYGQTNITGTFTTFVFLGEYNIHVEKFGYMWQDMFLIVDDPNQIYSVFIFLEPISSEIATLELVVFDDTNGQPIEGAEVYISGDIGLIQGLTDINGIFVVDLPLGEYFVDIFAVGFIPNSFNILLLNPNEFVSYFVGLLPEGAPMDFNIISPTDFEIVDGALVQVYFDATNPFDLEFIDVFVNGLYVTTVNFIPEQTIFVPVFAEGFNNITLMAQWFTGQNASSTVLIESINLVPYIVPEVGDTMFWVFSINFDPPFYVEFNMTVIDWVSPTEVLIDLNYRRYDATGTIELSNFYLVVNVLNGYVSNSDMWWLYQHFYFFSGLVDPLSANLGDTFPFWSWGEILIITGEGSWNGVEAWTFSNIFDSVQGLVLKENGLFVYYDQDMGIVIGEMIFTTLLPQTFDPPTVSDELDRTFEFGSVQDEISWMGNSEIPDFYLIYINGIEFETGNWSNGDNITVILENLELGEYLYEIIVVDTNGNFAYDSVMVVVEDTVAPTIDGPSTLIIEDGSVNNNLTWYLSDLDPLNYTILVDWTFVETGQWNNSVPIVINLDGLAPGTYEIYIEVFDGSYNIAIAIVIVTVQDTTAPFISSPEDLSFDHGEIGNGITWVISDRNLENYTVFVDGILVKTDSYNLNDIVEVVLDELNPGLYEFEIIVFDKYGNYAIDMVVVEVVDTTPPIVRGQTDFTYEEDSTDNYLSWIVSGDVSGTYQIYINYNDDYDNHDDDNEGMILLTEGNWTDGEAIEINIDGYDVGRYEFTAIFTDEYGNSKSDVVIVYVIPEMDDDKPPRRAPGFELWLSIIGLLGVLFIRKRKSV